MGAAERPVAAPPLVMFSGGKDSLALARVVRSGGPADFFLYNPAARQWDLAQSLAGGGVSSKSGARSCPNRCG